MPDASPSRVSRGDHTEQFETVVLSRHPGHDVADPFPVIEPLAHELDLLRRRLALRVDEREAEGGGEEGAAAGEVVFGGFGGAHGLGCSVVAGLRSSSVSPSIRRITAIRSSRTRLRAIRARRSGSLS